MTDVEGRITDDEARATAIELSDGVAAQSSTITSMSIGPSFSIGTMAESRKQVLVPFMSCRFKGTFGKDDDETPVDVILTFDNVAFLVKRLGEEYLEAMDSFEPIFRSGLAPSKARLDFAARWMEEGATALSDASRRIADLAARLEAEEAGPDEQSAEATTEALPAPQPTRPRRKSGPRRDH